MGGTGPWCFAGGGCGNILGIGKPTADDGTPSPPPDGPPEPCEDEVMVVSLLIVMLGKELLCIVGSLLLVSKLLLGTEMSASIGQGICGGALYFGTTGGS